MKNLKILQLGGDWDKLWAKICFWYNLLQNTFGKVKKNKVGMPWKHWSVFASFLIASAKLSFMEDRLGAALYPYNNLELSQVFIIF